MSYLPLMPGASGGNRVTDATSHTVNLPASIVVGELLIAVVTFDGNPTVTWPAGWTTLHAGVANGSASRVEARYRVADGSEGASITLTTNASEMFCYNVLRISDYQGTPEASTGAVGTSVIIDPDTLNPSWGTGDTLWLEVGAYDQGQRFVGSCSELLQVGTGTNPNQRADNANGCGQYINIIWRRDSTHNAHPVGINSAQAWRGFVIGVQSGSSGSSVVHAAAYAG